MKANTTTCVLAASILALSAAIPAQARTFGCVDLAAPPSEGEYAGWQTRGTRVAFDEIDTHPVQLWYVAHHLAQLYNNTGGLLGEYYQYYVRDWGPGDSTIYVRWWVLAPMTYTNTGHVQSQYPTGTWVDDYQYVNCFVPVPFG